MATSLGRLVIEIGADLRDMTRGIEEAEKRLIDTGKRFATVGAGMTGAITLPLYGIGQAALEAFDQVDGALDAIRVGTGATGEALAGLETVFDAVARAVPASLEDIGLAIADLNTRTGLTGPALEELATQFLEVSRITGTDLAGNIAGLTRLFGDWAVSAEDQSSAMDYLFRASQATGIELGRLSEVLVQYGAPLREFGLGLEESAALMAKWEREGVNAELVMGGLRQGLARLAKEGAEGGAGPALASLIEQIASMSDEAAATGIAMQTFGARAGIDMARAIREGRFSIDELVATLQSSEETIIAAADDTMDFAEAWTQTKNKLLLALEPLGSALQRAMQSVLPLLERGVGFVQNLADRFANLPQPLQTAIIVVAGLVAAIGPLLVALGAVIAAAPLVGGAIAALTGPIGLIAVGVAALAAAIIYNWDAISAATSAVWEAITGAISAAWDGVVSRFEAARDSVKAVIDGIIAFVRGLVLIINDALIEHLGVDVLGTFAQVWSNTMDSIGSVIDAVADAVKLAVDVIVAAFRTTKDAVVLVVSTMVDVINEQLIGRFTRIVDSVREKIDAVKGFFRDLYDKVAGRSYIPDMMDVIDAQMVTRFSTIVETAKGTSGDMRETTRADAASIESSFTQLMNSIRNVVTNIDDVLRGQFTAAVRDAFGGAISKAEELIGTFLRLKDDGISALVKLGDKLLDILDVEWGDLARKLLEFLTDLGDQLDKLQKASDLFGGSGKWAGPGGPPVINGPFIDFVPLQRLFREETHPILEAIRDGTTEVVQNTRKMAEQFGALVLLLGGRGGGSSAAMAGSPSLVASVGSVAVTIVAQDDPAGTYRALYQEIQRRTRSDPATRAILLALPQPE